MPLTECIANLVPRTGVALTGRERDMILEIAYLAIAADRKLRDEEIAAFGAVAMRLRALVTPPLPEPRDDDLDELLHRFATSGDPGVVEERLRSVAGDLREDVRGLVYKIAYGLSMCDLEAADAEFEFDLNLIDALELSNADAERLALDVEEACRA